MARSKGFIGGLLVLLLGSLTLLLVMLANGPDHDITFERITTSSSEPAAIGRAIANVTLWPKWHHMAIDAKLVDGRGVEYSLKDQWVMPGSIVKFVVEPKGQSWRRFELWAEVTAYEKDKLIGFRLLKDTSGKMTKAFDQLNWKIELLPSTAPGQKTEIRGTMTGHTAHWRSRLFGALTPRLLMNQVFYPDLLALSEMGNPVSTNPYSQMEQ